MSAKTVTVLGLGLMGGAMADALVGGDRAVTVWNRSAGRSDALVARGATAPERAEDAVAASELVLLSLSDFDATYSVLEPAADVLADRVVVNLSAGTPKQARDAATWVTERGGQYLTGGVRVPPSGIGQPDGVTFYSGRADVFDRCRDTLEVLTGTDYRGSDPGAAMLYYQLEEDLLWTTMVGYLHALAVAKANGVSAADCLPYATRTLSSVQELIAFFTPRIDEGDHRGELDRLATGLGGIEHIVATTEEAGVDGAVLAAIRDLFARGVADGHGEDSATSLVEVLRPATQPA